MLHLYTSIAAAWARSRRVAARPSRASAHGSSRSRTSSCLLHQGSGELHTVTGASLVDPHRPAREDPYRLSVGLVGAEAMLRLYVEEERNERAFEALTRFFGALDGLPAGSGGSRALDPLALAFQLKLLWLSGYVPHLDGCVECGGTEALVGYLPRAGGAVCAACAPSETVVLAPEGFRGILAFLWTAARGGARAGRGGAGGARCPRGRRRVVRVPRRLSTAHADGVVYERIHAQRNEGLTLVMSRTDVGKAHRERASYPQRYLRFVKRQLGDGYELDDDPAHRPRGGSSLPERGVLLGQGDDREQSRTSSSRTRPRRRSLPRRAQVGSPDALGRLPQSYLADVYVLEEHRGRARIGSSASPSTKGRSRRRSGSCTRPTRTTSTAGSGSPSLGQGARRWSR